MLTIGLQLLGKLEKKLKIFLLKKARTILRLARKGLSLFWLVIFKLSRYGREDRHIPAGEYRSGSRQAIDRCSGPVTSAKIYKGWIKDLVESHNNILL